MTLSKFALLRILPPVRLQMGKSATALDRLAALANADGHANLATALHALYPGTTHERALANLRQLRLDIAKAAQKSGIVLTLAGDKKTRTPAASRLIWFEGEDRMSQATEQWVQSNIQGPPRSPQDAVKLGPIRLYVVYSDKDETAARKLLNRLDPHFKTSDIEIWHHGLILPGENPRDERQRRGQTCDLALQLLSPHFQANGLDSECSARALPVLLQKLLDPPPNVALFTNDGKSFGDDKKPGDFALLLAHQIRAVLDQTSHAREDYLRSLTVHGAKFVPGSASSVSLRQELLSSEPLSNRCDALAFLHEWLEDPKAPPYCALFGELGMGKTTTAKEFARQLWERRKHNRKSPEAVFLDLRYVGDFAKNDPNLDKIIARILDRDWQGGPRSTPIDFSDIYQLVEQGALVIFDGLDEVLVHLTPSQGQLFTRQLFRLIPPNAPRGKLLITCRTHYFRTFRERASHFTLEGRDNLSGESYRALVLLPFAEDQIRTYLRNSFSPEEADKAYAFISTVHNLPELAQRPYTLNLITRQFSRLEEWKAAGKTLTGLTLYRFVVEEWLLRDGGKHQLTPDHKQMLMEYVAAALLRSGARSWSAVQLEQWLMDFLESHPGVASHYHGAPRDLLKEDLRTATFLVRDEGSDQFRFAHSSLQEYFLAHYLRRALEEPSPSAWALLGVSPETLDFLGQSLREQPSPKAVEGLTALRDDYHRTASELAFRYVLLAQAKGFPSPSAAGFQLPAADLFGLEIDHTDTGLLDLSNLNLKGAHIANTFWRNCRFTGSDFSGADAARAEWHDCDLSPSTWCRTDLEAAIFRRCNVEHLEYSNSHTYRASWLLCAGRAPANQLTAGVPKYLQLGHSQDLNGCAWSPDSRRVLSASDDKTLKIWDAASGDCLLTLSGHSEFVNGCAWSPDSRRVLSASDDNTLKIWDAASGVCLLTLSGHSSSTNGCAWSPDSRRVLSASSDNTLKIWDAASGGCLLTLFGHSQVVNGCAWSPDSRRVLSASGDNTLKIWDAASGDCLLTLSGHSQEVKGCAWSPDSRRVLSASHDKTLKIWDAASGVCLLTLFGHSSYVTGCAWSPDSQRVLSASWDGTLKIWDAASGVCLLTLSGQSQLLTGCAWSPDSRRVLSASLDKTLKIWDAASGGCLLTLSGDSHSVSGCAWSPDSRRVLSASADNTLKIWDAASGDCLLTLSGHSLAVSGCAWSPDSRRVLSSSDDDTLKIWDAASGGCLLTLSGHSQDANGCAWSPDSRRMLSASSDNTLKIWDTSGGCLLTLSGHSSSVNACAWSPDSRRVLSASSDETLKIWDAASGDCLLNLSSHSQFVNGCAWSPDGRRVLSASDDKTLKIWDAASGACILTLSGHSNMVVGCAWSPDSRRVLSASEDKTLKIWDAASGECLFTSPTHATPMNCHWSHNGQQILACFNDGSITFYDAATLRETGPRCYHLNAPHSKPSWATVDPITNHVLHHGEEAWRSVGYVVPDETGAPMWLPVETASPPSK